MFVLLPSWNSFTALLILRLVFPLIYHSISEEIPEEHRPLITRLYQLWLVLAATLIINMVACIFVLTSGSSDGGKDLGASIGCVSWSMIRGLQGIHLDQLHSYNWNLVVPLVVQVCDTRTRGVGCV